MTVSPLPLQASYQATDDVIRVAYRTEAKGMGMIGRVGGVSSREGTTSEKLLLGQVQKRNQLAATGTLTARRNPCLSQARHISVTSVPESQILTELASLLH